MNALISTPTVALQEPPLMMRTAPELLLHIEEGAAPHGIMPPPPASDEVELFSTYLAWRRSNDAWWQSMPGDDDDTTEDAECEDNHFMAAEVNLFRLVDLRAGSVLGIAALAHAALTDMTRDRPGTEAYAQDAAEPAFRLVAAILASALAMARSEANGANS